MKREFIFNKGHLTCDFIFDADALKEEKEKKEDKPPV